MNTCKCCERPIGGGGDGLEPSPPARPRGWLGRGIGLVKWMAPAAGLALMPKCPLCVVGYVALATGVGISVSTATWLRRGLIVVCVAALAYLAWRKLCRYAQCRSVRDQ